MSQIAIFITDHAEPYIEKFGSFFDQTKNVLEKAGSKDEIKGYDIVNSKFPTPDELQNIKGIWITGSRSDAFADEVWILKLRNYLRDVVFPTSIPVVGICFGHQIIGRALGAKVGRNERGWELGVAQVEVNKDPEVQELMRDFNHNDFEILEVHQDVVQEIPEGFKNIGSSKDAEVQGLYKKGKVLSFQGHPEFSPASVLDVLATKKKAGAITEEYHENAVKALGKYPHDGVDLTKVIIKFIENRS